MVFRAIGGFALVTSKLNLDADKTITIYWRFDKLSARDLLFYQAGLAELEDHQKRQDTEDRDAEDQASIESQSDWNKFSEAAESTNVANRRAKEKMELVIKIRVRLEKYRSSPRSIQACTMRSTNLTQIRRSTSFTSSSS